MKKKKLSQALPKKLTPAQIIDFCFYLQAALQSGMSIDIAMEAILPFLELPLRDSVQMFSSQMREDTDIIEALCTLANSHPEDVFRRLMKMLIFASLHGTLVSPYLESTIRTLEMADNLESSHYPDLVISDFTQNDSTTPSHA